MQRMLHNGRDASAGHSDDAVQWYLFIYRLPAEHASARSTVWREIKRLGALSLQHAVALLPRTDANRRALEQLRGRVQEYGGEASIFETCSPDSDWHTRAIARFNEARDEEYDEVVDETQRFREEIARERSKGKFTFAELEDEESNLERLRKYVGQVRERDLFGAPGRHRAEREVEHCATVLEEFAQDIYRLQEGLAE